MALMLLALVGGSPFLQAQQQTVIPPTMDHAEANAYRAFFHLVLILKDHAEKAKAQPKPNDDSRKVVPEEFGLSDAETSAVGKFAEAYQNGIQPLHSQAIVLRQQVRARLLASTALDQPDVGIPKEMLEIQDKEDAVALSCRDHLRYTPTSRTFPILKVSPFRITLTATPGSAQVPPPINARG